MQPYKMASTAIQKQPYKFIEIPLAKFIDEVIPHHEEAYEIYKKQMEKILNSNDVGQIAREINDKKRVIKQLKDLMYELDTLRTQVEDYDLDKFDVKTLVLRKKLLKLVSGYVELEKISEKVLLKLHNAIETDNDKPPEHPEEFSIPSQLQITTDYDKIQELQAKCNKVENIHKDVQDLHDMYKDLNSLVSDQATKVDIIEETTESTGNNVKVGTKILKTASKLKVASYPITGAFIGTMIGGPLGFIAGLKVGGAAALGCALAGYTGGKYLKKSTEENFESDMVNNENIQNEQVETEKKDI